MTAAVQGGDVRWRGQVDGLQRRASRGRRRSTGAAALLFAVLVPVLLGSLLLRPTVADAGDPPRFAAPATGVPTSAAAQAVDPQYPFAGYLRATIGGIAPTVVTRTAGNVLTVTGTVTNASAGTLYDLRYVWQRGVALAGVKAVRAEIATPSRPTAVVDQNWTILGRPTLVDQQTDLAPGASMPFTATVAIVASDGLALTERGVYPLMIKVSGDIGQNGAIQYERVGEIHLLATVLSLPAAGPAVAGALPAVISSESGSQDPGTADDPGTSTDLPTQGFPTQGFPTPTSAEAAGAFAGVSESTGSPASSAPVTSAQLTTAVAASTGTAASTTPGSAVPPAPDPVARPVALNMLWPLVDTPHVGVSGVFLNDDLARAIAPGGRLATVLSGLSTSSAAGTATTVVVDPELLDELEQMSAGYRVVSVPGPAQAALTPSSTNPTSPTSPISSTVGTSLVSPPNTGPPTTTPGPAGSTTPTDSTGTGSTPRAVAPAPNTVTGRGQAAAITFLAALRTAIAGHQILVLPYSDPDSVAMVRAGLDGQLSDLIATGRTVAARILQTPPGLVMNMARPAGGMTDAATLGFLSAHGMSQALLAGTTLTRAGGGTGAIRIDASSSGGRVVRAAVADSGLLPAANEVISRGNSAGLATRLTELAALTTASALDGTATPLIIAPDNRWTPGPAGLANLVGLMRTLQAGGVVTGTPLTTIAASATAVGGLDYPGSAEQAELDPGYLAAVTRDTAGLNSVGASLSQARGTDTPAPAELLEPLRAALLLTTSSGLRTNPRVGHSILRTTELTLAALRAEVFITGDTAGDGSAGALSYTLAASTSPLLVTVRNDLPYVVRVRVTIVDGQTVGMTATDPGVQSIPAGRSQQFKIATKVIKAGKFQVHAQLQATNGAPWGDRTLITVKSSAYGTLTIVLIAVAGGALFLMVVIRIAQRIKHRNDPVANDPATASNLAGAGASSQPGAHPGGPAGPGDLGGREPSTRGEGE